jgi:RNA polymerase sigma-70 factor (ECF subfamily)
VPDTNRSVDPTPDFDALYAAHRDDVWRYLRRRSASEPEDLTTEVFLVAWRRRAELPAAPLPWLYGVARKVLANHRRGGARREALTERAGAHAAPDPAEAFGVRDELARALASLSDRDRELVLLVAWEGLSLAEAASASSSTRRPGRRSCYSTRRPAHCSVRARSATRSCPDATSTIGAWCSTPAAATTRQRPCADIRACEQTACAQCCKHYMVDPPDS